MNKFKQLQEKVAGNKSNRFKHQLHVPKQCWLLQAWHITFGGDGYCHADHKADKSGRKSGKQEAVSGKTGGKSSPGQSQCNLWWEKQSWALSQQK